MPEDVPTPAAPPARGRRRRVAVALAAAVLAAVAVVAALAAGAGDGPSPAERAAPRTALVPRPATGEALVWAVGDGADGGEAAKALAKRIAAERPDRFLYLGDVYPHGTADDFTERYEPVYGALAGRTSPTPGNHEWSNREQGYDWWWRQVTGETPAPWYDLELAGWQLLSLNTEAAHGPGSEQVRWLRERVDGPGTCRLAFWHRPLESAGDHGDQPDVAPLWEPLRARAALVLTAHDHSLQRLRPRDGIVQVVAGAGGHELYGLDEDDPRLEAGLEDVVGGARLRLRPGRAVVELVDVDGRVRDRTVVRCEQG